MIKVYGARNCSSCNMAKNILNARNIKFEYVDIEKASLEDAKLIQECGIKALPIIIQSNVAMSLKELLNVL